MSFWGSLWSGLKTVGNAIGSGLGTVASHIVSAGKYVGQKVKEHIVDPLVKEVKARGTTILTGTNYVGPYNNLDESYLKTHPPTDNVDKAGLFHDQEYSQIARNRDAGKISSQEASDLIRDSDKRFIHNVDRYKHENEWASSLGGLGIKTKMFLEDLGLDRNKFVTQ